MIRRVIEIDDKKCSGCGICVKACHEGAIGLVNGKAKLMRDDYCDGLGDCLPECPKGAISFVEREAAAYDEAAVKINKLKKINAMIGNKDGCPGSMAKKIEHTEASSGPMNVPGRLSQWPVQIKLTPINAPYFENASLLIAADCTAYAYGNFHNDFIKGRITLVGCPKLDGVDYSEKLAEIIKRNNIHDITLTRMTVPCCGGLEFAVKKAIALSGKNITLNVTVISPDGSIVESRSQA